MPPRQPSFKNTIIAEFDRAFPGTSEDDKLLLANSIIDQHNSPQTIFFENLNLRHLCRVDLAYTRAPLSQIGNIVFNAKRFSAGILGLVGLDEEASLKDRIEAIDAIHEILSKAKIVSDIDGISQATRRRIYFTENGFVLRHTRQSEQLSSMSLTEFQRQSRHIVSSEHKEIRTNKILIVLLKHLGHLDRLSSNENSLKIQGEIDQLIQNKLKRSRNKHKKRALEALKNENREMAINSLEARNAEVYLKSDEISREIKVGEQLVEQEYDVFLDMMKNFDLNGDKYSILQNKVLDEATLEQVRNNMFQLAGRFEKIQFEPVTIYAAVLKKQIMRFLNLLDSRPETGEARWHFSLQEEFLKIYAIARAIYAYERTMSALYFKLSMANEKLDPISILKDFLLDIERLTPKVHPELGISDPLFNKFYGEMYRSANKIKSMLRNLYVMTRLDDWPNLNDKSNVDTSKRSVPSALQILEMMQKYEIRDRSNRYDDTIQVVLDRYNVREGSERGRLLEELKAFIEEHSGEIFEKRLKELVEKDQLDLPL